MQGSAYAANGGYGKKKDRGWRARRKRWKAGWVEDLSRPGARGAAEF